MNTSWLSFIKCLGYAKGYARYSKYSSSLSPYGGDDGMMGSPERTLALERLIIYR